MKRFKLSKNHSQNLFRSSANNVKAINVSLKPMRGGYRI